MRKLNVLQIRVALLNRGYSISQWSKEHGFSQKTVSQVLHKWLNRTDDCPRGVKTRKILKDLSRTLGVQLNPLV
jgi:gp16 family phage-associated protein